MKRKKVEKIRPTPETEVYFLCTVVCQIVVSLQEKAIATTLCDDIPTISSTHYKVSTSFHICFSRRSFVSPFLFLFDPVGGVASSGNEESEMG